MELEDLKSAWNRFSSENEKIRQLPENEFRKIIKKRTVDISHKIGRNIRIGIGLVLAWVCFWFTIDFISSPFLVKSLDKPYLTNELMLWAFILESFIYLLIFASIIVFWIRYNKIEKTKIDSSNLRSQITQLISIVSSYRKMFYIILWIILLYSVIIFSSSFVMAFGYQIKEAGLDVENLKFLNWIILIVIFLISMTLIALIYYLPFNFFYKRLYGKYLKQLKTTLAELNEPTTPAK